jgi:hypothetical protein
VAFYGAKITLWWLRKNLLYFLMREGWELEISLLGISPSCPNFSGIFKQRRTLYG